MSTNGEQIHIRELPTLMPQAPVPDSTSNTSLAHKEPKPKVFLISSYMNAMGSSASSADVKSGSAYAALRGPAA
jgi:hypothetical protein